MDWLIPTIQVALAAGLATTFDDNIYLTGFFSEVNRTFRPKHVAVGELLGFTVLLTISLLGFLLGLVVSEQRIGLLGILPILIGLHNLREHFSNSRDAAIDKQQSVARYGNRRGFDSRRLSLWDVLWDRQTYNVAAISISNGGNNLGIYIPLLPPSVFSKLSSPSRCSMALF
jgi:cadmium resistance protein CadD (predicted permease)